GPIANPGMAALYAAVNPENTKYFYYALGDDNSHHFFQTYSGFTEFLASQERYNHG
ncbi:MAG: endolytic transglycosylase MltG, partial [Oscillospiraceae bacterium]|nr:endolytic transglycosylase MltG [Oscillospiraceae bacterium]